MLDSERFKLLEVRANGKAAMRTPEVRAKLSAASKGRPQHPNTIAACRELGKRPKSEEWKRGQSERSRKNPKSLRIAEDYLLSSAPKSSTFFASFGAENLKVSCGIAPSSFQFL